MPVNTGGGLADPDGLIAGNAQGPWFYSDYSKLRLRATRDEGDVYQAANLIGGQIDTNDWYEIRVAVDPRRDIDGEPGAGGRGAAQVYVRNLSDGEAAWTLLEFDNLATPGVTESLSWTPLALREGRGLADFDGWETYFHGYGTMIDDLMALPVVLGDFDGNGAINGLDIPGMRAALADSEAWWAANPECYSPQLLGDFNADGAFNGLDIPGFKAAVSASSIPDPLTLLLVAGGLVVVERLRR